MVSVRSVLITTLALAYSIAYVLNAQAQQPQGAYRRGSSQSSGQSNGQWSGQWSGKKDGRPSFDMTPTVAVATVTTSDVPQYLTAVGTVTSHNTATVRARVSGQLDKVLFREGQLVKAGDVVAVLDQRPYQVALDQQLAQLQRDQAQLENAKHDLDRYQGLVADKVISQQQVDTQAALVRQYQGVVAIDQAQVANARLNFSYTSITAPVSGRLGLRQVDPGNLVTSNDVNGIVVITQLNPINVIFAIPGDRVPAIIRQLNSGAKLAADALDRDGKTKLASGVLITADNQIDATTGTVKLKAEFNNDNAALFPNQFVNVRLQLSTSKGATVIPAAAIQQNDSNSYVYVVKPDMKVVRRQVMVSLTDNAGNAIIAKGLSVGEQVVTDGLDKLRDGTTIKISSTAAAHAAASGNAPQSPNAQRWKKPDGSQSAPGDKNWQHKQPVSQ